MKKIVVEKFYNKDYQRDDYIARIVDENNKVLKYGINKYASEQEAYSDGQRLLYELNKYEYKASSGIGLGNKKWIKNKRGLRLIHVLMIIVVVLLYVFVSFLVCDKDNGSADVYFILISCFVFVLLVIFMSNSIKKERYMFMLDNDNLYAINLINTNYVTSTGMPVLDATNALAHSSEENNIKNIYAYVNSLADVEKFQIKKEIFKITEIVSVTKGIHGRYKIVCFAINLSGNSNKIVSKKFYFSNKFNDYELLIKTLNYLKNKTNLVLKKD